MVIRLLLVDDHPIIRQGLATLLAEEADFAVVATVGSAEGLRADGADVIVMDLEMPGPDPLLCVRGLPVPVVIFTAYDDRVADALEAGVRGYVLKGAPTEELARAIRLAFAGGTYLEPRVAARLARSAGLALTARQREILKLVAAGRSNKEIAAALGITERTAKFHLTSIMNRLGAENRAQAVALALERHLL